MIYIGIDPGIAHCGFAAVNEDCQLEHCAVFTSTRDKKRKGDTQARLLEMLAWVYGKTRPLADRDRLTVAVEWPMVSGRGGGGTGWRQQSHARGSSLTFAAAGALVAAMHYPLTPLPATWRAAVMPKTKTADLHDSLERMYGVSKLVGKTKAPHACDAIGLALYAKLEHERHKAKEAA